MLKNLAFPKELGNLRGHFHGENFQRSFQIYIAPVILFETLKSMIPYQNQNVLKRSNSSISSRSSMTGIVKNNKSLEPLTRCLQKFKTAIK